VTAKSMAMIVACVVALAGCSAGPSTPAGSGRGTKSGDAATAVAAIRAAGRTGAELDVQPLRDPQVQDLRDRAEAAEAKGDTRQAEALVDQALTISVDDPDLLQWKAELAIHRRDWTAAEQLAAQSYARGPKLGGLCRRNWATIGHARGSRGDAAGATTAKANIPACTVAPPVRM
jgi:hypothetical protein